MDEKNAIFWWKKWQNFDKKGGEKSIEKSGQKNTHFLVEKTSNFWRKKGQKIDQKTVSKKYSFFGRKNVEISTYEGNLNEIEKTSKKVEKSEKNGFFRVKTGFFGFRRSIYQFSCSEMGRKPVSEGKKADGGTCFAKNGFFP